MPKSWRDTKGNNKNDWRDAVDLYKFKNCTDLEFNHIRLLGTITSASIHWVEITTKDQKKTSFPITCCGYDPETEFTNESKCPACLAKIKTQKFYLQNAIIRHLQEDKPANARSMSDYPEEIDAEFRKKGDKSWSPIRVVKITSTTGSKLKDIVSLNKHKINGKPESMDISDPKYGMDIFIKFDKDETAASMYNPQRGDHAPLTDEEKMFKLFNLDVVKPDPEKSEKDLLRLGLLKPSRAQYNKPEDMTNPDDELSLDDREELPPTLEDGDFEDSTPSFKSMDRKELIKYVKENGLVKFYKFSNKLTDEQIIEGIKIAEEKKNSDVSNASEKAPPCFGEYDGKAKCLNCKFRTRCLEKLEGN